MLLFIQSLIFRFDGEVFDGSIGGIFHTMSILMNFTYSSIPSIDGFYGAKVSALSHILIEIKIHISIYKTQKCKKICMYVRKGARKCQNRNQIGCQFTGSYHF